MSARKADFSYLWGDERMADVTITIKIKPPAEEAGEQEQQEQQEQQPAKRARRGRSAAAAASSTAHHQQQDDNTGVVATMRVHGLVMAQRSEYV